MSTELHRIAILVIGILSTYVSGLDRPHRAGDTADTHARAHRDAVFDQHAAPDLYAVPNGYASPDSDTVVCGGVGDRIRSPSGRRTFRDGGLLYVSSGSILRHRRALLGFHRRRRLGLQRVLRVGIWV